jgi:hypothetical protein
MAITKSAWTWVALRGDERQCTMFTTTIFQFQRVRTANVAR